MSRIRNWAGAAVAAAAAVMGDAAVADSNWTSAGHDIQNTRNQSGESKISVANVGTLGVKWAFTTDGDVSAIPAVDGSKVYVPDWAGNLFAVDRKTGQQVWKVSIAAASGVPFDKARATPVVFDDKVIVLLPHQGQHAKPSQPVYPVESPRSAVQDDSIPGRRNLRGHRTA